MIHVAEKGLELSAYEGTKKVRETSDIVICRETTDDTKDTKKICVIRDIRC